MSFIIVKYGDEREQIFNSNCRNEVLLEYIKTRCACDDDDTIELCDENGSVKQMQKHPSQYACKSCKDRETLILLRVDLSPDHERGTVYVPLLRGLEHQTDFLAQLNPKPMGGKKGHRKSLISDKPLVKEKKMLKTRQTSRTSIKSNK